MGCPAEVVVGNNFTFGICTHDPDTAEQSDADAEPTWRLYEGETVVPILTGTMSLLDAVNTVGFYTETIAATALNGFVVGQTYTLYISAIVDSAPGGISYAIQAVSALGAEAGAIEFIYNVTDVDTGLPVANVHVWVTTDVGGLNVVASGVTDMFGNVTFWLDPGTFYFWRTRVGYNFVNPDIEIVV